MTERSESQTHETHTGLPKLARPKTAMWPAIANRTMVRKVRLGEPETIRNTRPDSVSQVPVHRIGSPLLYPRNIPPPRSSRNFSALWAHSFGGWSETLVIQRDNMGGLKNWAVFSSGHDTVRNSGQWNNVGKGSRHPVGCRRTARTTTATRAGRRVPAGGRTGNGPLRGLPRASNNRLRTGTDKGESDCLVKTKHCDGPCGC
jgi:hypothetical protein